MILKKIKLENIRSYENLEVDFPKGSILLSGDIGSGKTSILLAIEFALFGLQPGQKGASLLRYGNNEAKVTINFQVNNQEVEVERGLKKSGRSISQDSCSITIDNHKRELSVTELKNAVLTLLNYPPEFAKKTNLLYKFTVYTPQEGMKQIINENSETRLDTLRHIFGIDKYKKIKENSSILLSKIREKIRINESLFESLDEKTKQETEKQEQLKKTKENIGNLSIDLNNIISKRKIIEENIKEIQEKINEKNNIEREIEKNKIFIEQNKQQIDSNNSEIDLLIEQTKELENIKFNQQALEKAVSELQETKNKIEAINRQILEKSGKVSAFKIKNDEAEIIKLRLSNMKICPTCLQDVVESHKKNIQLKYEKEISENKNLSLEIQEKISFLEKQKQQEQQEQEKIEKTIEQLKMLKIKLESFNEKKQKIEQLKKINIEKQENSKQLQGNLVSLDEKINNLTKFSDTYEQEKNNLEETRKNEKQIEIKIAELNKEKQFLEEQINQIEKEIEKQKQIKQKYNHLKELESWLLDVFLPLISFTEKNVMIKLREEFLSLFSKWFSILVSDVLNARIDEDFTPIIEQQGYELDYSFLSGGERTAIALAYRLALNQVINSLLSKIKTKDFLILDEPTDGFSSEQLDKMRDVLQQLNVEQLILVSHEQKIEGFVDNIIRLKKQHGSTLIETTSSGISFSEPGPKNL